MDKKKSGAFALLFFTFFIWGSVYVGAKLLSGKIPPLLLGCLRMFVGALCLLWMARKHLDVKIEKRDWLLLALIGFLGYYASMDLIQLGIAWTGASMAALLNALNPVSVTLFAAAILHEKITPVKILCLLLALAGTMVITGGSGGSGELLGMLAVLLSVVTWGISSVCVRKLTAKYPPVLITAYGLCFSLIFHIPTGIAVCVSQGAQIDFSAVLVILYLGIFGSGVSQFTWNKCLSVLPASTCSLFYPLQAMFSALLGALLLHESFRPSFFIGLALISADVALNTLDAHREGHAAHK